MVGDSLAAQHRRLLLAIVGSVKGRWVVLLTPLTAADAHDHAQEAVILGRSEQAHDVSVSWVAEVIRFKRVDYDVAESHKTLQRYTLRQNELLVNTVGCGAVGNNAYRRRSGLLEHRQSELAIAIPALHKVVVSGLCGLEMAPENCARNITGIFRGCRSDL